MNQNPREYLKKLGIFLGIFSVGIILLLIIQNIFSITQLSITDILLFFIIELVVYLFISGGIREFTWGSLSIKMQEIAKEKMEIVSQEVGIQEPTQVEKGNEEFLYRDLPKLIKKNPRKNFVLIITRRNENEKYYASGVISLYLRTGFFDHVVFIDEDKFNAYISAKKLLGIIRLRQMEIEKMINDWRISDIPGVETESLNEPLTIGLLMNIFENKRLKDIALINKDGKFLSIFTKEQLTEQIVDKLSIQ